MNPAPAPTAVPPLQLSITTRLNARLAGLMTSLPPAVLRGLGRRRNSDGEVLDADVRASLLALEVVSGEDFVNLSIEEGRRSINEEAHLGALKYLPVGSATEHFVNGVKVRHYRPAGKEDPSEALPTLIYFHGGGWTLGSLDSHDSTCRWFCARGDVAVLSVDYRLAPEAPFPAGLDDVTTVVSAALAGDIKGVRADRVAVGGDSAGGNLAAVVCLRLRDEGKPMPQLQMLFVPVTDLRSLDTQSHKEFATKLFLTREQIDWCREHYLAGVEERNNPYVSPLAASDLSGLPAAYVAVAGFDPLRDEGEAYARKMEEAGVPVTLRRHSGLVHPFVNSTGVWRGARVALDEAVGALRLALGVVST